MKRWSVVLVLLAGFLHGSIAADSTELASRLLDATGEGSTFNDLRNRAMKQFDRSLRNATNQSDQARSDLAKIPSVMAETLSWESIRAPLSAAYADVFSPEELEALIAFFESPAGRKYLAEKPALDKRKRDIMMRLATDAAVKMANQLITPTEILVPSPSGMQTVIVDNAGVTTGGMHGTTGTLPGESGPLP